MSRVVDTYVVLKIYALMGVLSFRLLLRRFLWCTKP